MDNNKPKFKQIEINQNDLVKTLNEQSILGYRMTMEVSKETTKVSQPDAHGVSYGGDTFVTLIFELND